MFEYKIARKSQVEEDSEEVQEEASELGKALARRKKGKASKAEVAEEKEEVEEAQDELGESLRNKKMRKKASTDRGRKEHDATKSLSKKVTGTPKQPSAYRPLGNKRTMAPGALNVKDADGYAVDQYGNVSGSRRPSSFGAPKKYMGNAPKLEKKAMFEHLKVALKDSHPLRGVQRAIENTALHRADRSKSQKEIAKSNPGYSVLTGNTAKGEFNKLYARKGAFAAKHPVQALVPFRGMGAEGEKHLKKLKKKRGQEKTAVLRFTEGGKKSLRSEAKDIDRHSGRQQVSSEKHPGTSYMVTGEGIAAPVNKLRARKKAYTADHPVQALIPFRGMGAAGKKSLQKLKKKK